MLGEHLAPCWCYSSIRLDRRKKACRPTSLHALVGQSVTLNTPCEVDQRFYVTLWRETGVAPSGENESWLNMEQRGDGMSILDILTDTHIKRVPRNTHNHADAIDTFSSRMREKEFDRSATVWNKSALTSAARWIWLFTFTNTSPRFFLYLYRFTPPQTFLPNYLTIFAHMCVVDKFWGEKNNI